MPSICLRGRQRGQQVRPVCLVRILLKGTHGRLVCCSMAWLHSVGVFAITPHHQTSSCTYARHSAYVGWHGAAYEHGNIYYMWVMVVCNTLTSLGGRGLWPPSLPLMGCACTLTFAHTIFNHNLKIEFQIKILNKFWNYCILQVTFSDLCLCTQLATSISP
jgi:hypothetical protein